VRWPRLGNPLSWKVADRCYAIAILMLVSTSLLAISTVAGGWPFLSFPAEQSPYMLLAQCISLASWGAIALGARIARRLDLEPRALAIATVTLYAVTLGGFTLVTGPFASPGWIAYLGGAVVGYVMFPRWLVLVGMVVYVVIVAGGALLHPSWLAPAPVFAGFDVASMIRHSVASLSVFALTFLVIAWIVDRWRDREARYQRLASIDSLTGLTNRRRFFKLADQELARSRRYGSPLSVVLVDLDHFKRVNDEHGHLVGDQALAHAASILAREVRDVDTVARYGGEEFAILLPMTDAIGAREVAERCARQLASEAVPATRIRITASMGIACAEGHSAPIEELLRAADTALYRAKEAGRDRVEVASPSRTESRSET